MLREKVNFDDKIQMACLPSESNFYPGINLQAIFVGWGQYDNSRQISRYLKYAKMHILNGTSCDSEFVGAKKDWESQICVVDFKGSNSICPGKFLLFLFYFWQKLVYLSF